MSDYKRLTKKDGFTKNLDLTQELGYSHIYNRLAELENKIEDGKLLELQYKEKAELRLIQRGMLYILYTMCLEQNIGIEVFKKYKSEMNRWFENYLEAISCRMERNEKS